MAAPYVYLQHINLTDEEARKHGIPTKINLDPHSPTIVGAPQLGGKFLFPHVSDTMCTFEFEGGKLLVEPGLNALNGMRVNDTDMKIIVKRELLPGDIISFAPIIRPGTLTPVEDKPVYGVWSSALVYKVVWETGFEFNCLTCSYSSKQTVIDPSHMTACPVCKTSGDQLLFKQVKKSLKRPLGDGSDSPDY